MKLKSLNKQYEEHLKKFNKTGEHPHPSELLALLLLPEKEKFLPSENPISFYEYYEEEIKEKIEQVIVDFAITKKEIIEYIEKTVIYESNNYEEYKIWFVFANGFGVLNWGLLYHRDWSPESIHNAFSNYWSKIQPKDDSTTKTTQQKNYKSRVKKR